MSQPMTEAESRLARIEQHEAERRQVWSNA